MAPAPAFAPTSLWPRQRLLQATASKPQQRLLPATASTFSLLTQEDLRRFANGTHSSLYGKLGAHPVTLPGMDDVYFAIWAPQATAVSVVGDFNRGETGAHRLERCQNSGIWETFIRADKFRLTTPNGQLVDKCDPFAFHAEIPPRSASVVWDLITGGAIPRGCAGAAGRIGWPGRSPSTKSMSACGLACRKKAIAG